MSALYLLRSIPHSDHAQIVRLLLPNSEIRSALYFAGKRRRLGHLQPFQAFQAKWSGRGELNRISDIEHRGHHHLRGQRLWAGLYLNELMEKISRHLNPIDDTYELYVDTLNALEQADISSTLRWFEFHFLAKLGYELDLSGEQGDFLCWNGHEITFSTIAKPHSISSITLGHIRDQQCSQEEAKSCKVFFYRILCTLLPDGKIDTWELLKKKTQPLVARCLVPKRDGMDYV